MFGIKVIRKSHYEQLLSELQERSEQVDELSALKERNTKLENDIAVLRQQNGDLRATIASKDFKIRDLKDHIDAQKRELRAYKHYVRFSPPKCDLCNHEQENCKKFSVGDREICILQDSSFQAKKQ